MRGRRSNLLFSSTRTKNVDYWRPCPACMLHMWPPTIAQRSRGRTRSLMARSPPGSHGCCDPMATFGPCSRERSTFAASIPLLPLEQRAMCPWSGVADVAAGAGATTAGRTAQHQLQVFYARKQTAYSKLMRAITARLVRVRAEVRRSLDEARKTARGR